MKELARDNMPFMALEIHGLKEVTLRQDLPHTVSMLQRGIQIRTVEDLINLRLDSGSSSLYSKLTSSGGGHGGQGGIHSGTSMEISSMTSGSFDKSDGSRQKKSEKPSAKQMPTPKLREASKGLPMISEKSGTPSEVSGNNEINVPRFSDFLCDE